MTTETKAVVENQPEPERTCSNCACSLEAKHPTLINKTQLLCRMRPPMLMTQVMRDDKGNEINALSLTYAPTAPDLVCFDGWRPMGVLPGQKPFTMGGIALPPEISALFEMLSRNLSGERDQ